MFEIVQSPGPHPWAVICWECFEAYVVQYVDDYQAGLEVGRAHTAESHRQSSS